MWEDPIVAELHRVRLEIYTRFKGDMSAYLQHIRAGEEEERKRGRQIISSPIGPSVPSGQAKRRTG